MGSRRFAPGEHVAPARFLLFAAIFALVAGLAAGCGVRPRTALLAGFDIAAFVFLGAITPLFAADPAAMRRTAAPTAVDELYRRRAAERCAEGVFGLMCREALRFELCEGKWSREARSGMTTCRLNG